MDMIFYGVVLIFCAVGVIDLIRFIAGWVFSLKKSEEKICIIPLKGHVENLEFVMRAVRSRGVWNYCANESVYLIDLGLDDESKEMVGILQEELGGIYYCTQETLPGMIQQNLNLQTL